MSRPFLLLIILSPSAVGLANGAFAQSANTITGGGSTLAQFVYQNEFSLFNSNSSPNSASFSNPDGDNSNDTLFWPSGSANGQSAFLDNNLSTDANAVNPTIPLGSPGGNNAVSYAASDIALTSAQYESWINSPIGLSAAGHLIQIPALGFGVAIPVVNAKVTRNGATTGHKPVSGGVILTDDDLCGIFSGKINDWSHTSASTKLAAGPISVAYHSESSGLSAALLNHFSAVCTTTNSNFIPVGTGPNVAVNITSVFANAGFMINGASAPTGVVPANFVGEEGNSGVASYLNNAELFPPANLVTSAIGYVTPDVTTIAPNSNAVLANGAKSTLVVAALKASKTVGLPYIPDVASIASALNHVAQVAPGSPMTAPTNAEMAADPRNFVQVIQAVSLGYPIVGYTTFDLAQCYQNRAVGLGIIDFFTQFYSDTTQFAATAGDNGFVRIGSTSNTAKVFFSAIRTGLLTNKKRWNDNIENPIGCAAVTGR